MSRTRTKNTIVTSPASLQRSGRYNHPSFLGWAYIKGLAFKHETVTYPYTVSSYDSKVGEVASITDETGNPGEYNPVTHTKTVWNCPLSNVLNVHESLFSGKSLRVESTGAMSCGSGNLGYGLTLGSFPTSEASDIATCLSGMQFGIQSSGFDLPVFLGELKDFNSLYSSLWKYPGNPRYSWDYIFNQFLRFHRNAENMPIRTVLNQIASMNLFNNFAIQPLISDLRQLSNLEIHIRRQIDRLRSLKPVAVRHSNHVNLTETSFDGTDPAIYTTHGFKVTASGYRRVTACAYVKYHIDQALKSPSAWKLLGDTVGFNNPWNTAWQLMPWSFLVDYFVGIGDFLSQFKGNLVEVPFTVTSGGYSVKTVRRARCTLYTDSGQYNDAWANAGSTSITGDVEQTSYVRATKTDFSVFALPQLKLPNLKQSGNIASIAYLLNQRH